MSAGDCGFDLSLVSYRSREIIELNDKPIPGGIFLTDQRRMG